MMISADEKGADYHHEVMKGVIWWDYRDQHFLYFE
jgi:hypothetical protein